MCFKPVNWNGTKCSYAFSAEKCIRRASKSKVLEQLRLVSEFAENMLKKDGPAK